MSISVRTTQQHSGGNHGAILYRDLNNVEIGVAFWDPARGQFAFLATPEDQTFTAAYAATIVTVLNGLSR